MVTVAIVAHRKKGRLIGGLGELRRILDEYGVVDPIWIEVDKSRGASRAAQRAVDEGADLIFVWGGDGTVQRCVHALAGQPVDIAILPAGTANLLATNLQQISLTRLTSDSTALDESWTSECWRISASRSWPAWDSTRS
jgi:diacylglycerol kinase (ATP)